MSSNDRRDNWFEHNPGKTKLLVLLVCLLLIEGMVRIVVWAGLLPYERYPTSREPQYWAYIDPVVGIWRHPYADFVDEGRCYTTHYTSNSVGARDRDRAVESDANRRVQVIKNTLDNKIYILNALRLGNRIVKDRSKALIPGAPEPTYEQYSEEDLEIFLYALGKIAEATEGKRLHLFLIPRAQDMAHAETVGYDFEDYTLGCDGHRGQHGHEATAALVFDYFATVGSPTPRSP